MSRSASRPRVRPTLQAELAEDYVDEAHMATFADALAQDDIDLEHNQSDATQPTSPLMSPHYSGLYTPHGPRVRKVRSATRFGFGVA
jgi:hypothetical protein